jgi:hypothetical protein
MGHCGKWQLSQLPHHVDGTLPVFSTHPFRFIDQKEQGRIHKQPDGSSPTKAPLPKMQFFMDFGFMQASSSDYHHP